MGYYFQISKNHCHSVYNKNINKTFPQLKSLWICKASLPARILYLYKAESEGVPGCLPVKYAKLFSDVLKKQEENEDHQISKNLRLLASE